MDENNELRIRKIHVKTFIETLISLYDRGVDYIDVIGILDDVQDSIGLSFSVDYMAEDMRENFNKIPEKRKDNEIKINKNISDEDLNQLL